MKTLVDLCRAVFCAFLFCAVIGLAGAPGNAMGKPDDLVVYLFDADGNPTLAVGYSVVDNHALDPDEIVVGDVDTQGNIWDSQGDDIGYVDDVVPDPPVTP